MIAEAKVVGGQQELIARYVRGQGLITTADTHNNTAYYLHNGHGDVVELRDETGNTRLNSYSYDIWGNPVTEQETVHNSFRYAGEMWDNTTSLQYLRARWYDPSDGRFINEDTYEGQIDNPLSLNLYTYVYNNPLIWIDPTGHSAEYSLSIYSDPNDGHSFVVIVNNSSSDIMVGVYSLKAGESVSLGTYGNKKGNNGIFYNLEAWLNSQGNYYSQYVSLTMNFDSSELETINKFIGSHDTWGLWNNCSYFASGLWNSISDTKLNSKGFLGINRPSILANSIKNVDGYETGRKFATASEVGYSSKGIYTVSKVYGIGSSQGSANSSSSSSSSGSSSWSGSSGAPSA